MKSFKAVKDFNLLFHTSVSVKLVTSCPEWSCDHISFWEKIQQALWKTVPVLKHSLPSVPLANLDHCLFSFYCTRLSPLWESYENRRPVFIWVTAKPQILIITTSASLIMDNEVMFQNSMEGYDSNCLLSISSEATGLLISLQTSLRVFMRKKRKMNSTAQDQMAFWYWKGTWRP